ncbi:O-antigen ligase family protein [Haladaptatus caseinilyticus]|uniref:O-antigen ligase family protein n=1 Tax=Haladaptatus caseinilyticus TaxID=2993314 RepID=UPI00224B28A7|nr:O-antigen ligase family protein [Haladaptatus caseinilyticus]
MSTASETITTTVSHQLNKYQRAETPFSPTGDAVFLSVLLTVGLLFATPAIATLLNIVGVPMIYGLLASLALIISAYSVFVISIGAIPVGVCVAAIITATISSNVPLLSSATEYPANIGPHLWLVFIPLGILVAMLALRQSTFEVIPVEMLIIGMAVWALLGAILGSPERPLVAVFFSLYVGVLAVSFGAMYRAVQRGYISPRGVVYVLLVVAAGHAVFGVVQFAAQGSFGFSFLGEVARDVSKSRAVFPIGGLMYGLYISGLTGGSAPLSILLAFVTPLSVGFAIERRGSYAVLSLPLLLSFALFLTAKESAFMGLFAGLGVGALLWAIGNDWIELSSLVDRRVIAGGSAVIVAGVVGSLWYLQRLFENSNSASIRFRQLAGGIQMALDNPLFGIGGANYAYTASQYNLPSQLGGGSAFPIHSMIVGMFAEIGFVGGLLFLLALGLVFLSALSSWIARPTAFRAGIVGAVVAYVVVGFWVTPLRYANTIPFWFLAGALVGSHE